MKKIVAILSLLSLFVLPTPSQAADLSYTLKGRILLQTEANGEAWYLNPVNRQRYFLGRPDDAFAVMRELGLGIAHTTLTTYLKGTFPLSLSGRIMLDVQSHGEAYYVSPVDRKGYFLGRPADAFAIMRSKGLGISTANLATIPMAKYKQWTKATPNMTIFYPETWTLDTTNTDIDMMALSPVGTSDQFSENVNVLHEALPVGETYTTEEYAMANIETLRAAFTNFQEVSGRMVRIGNTQAYREEYIAEYQFGNDPADVTTLHWTQWFISYNGNGYVITYTAMPDAYDQFLKPVEQMVNSFMVK